MADPEYFTLDEVRSLPDVTEGGFIDDQINAAAAYFVQIVEREVGVPFIPRTYTKTLDGSGKTAVVLPHARIRSLTSVTLDGVAVATNLLTAEAGVLRYLAGDTWPIGVANLVVVYVTGDYATCPADVKDAVMWATRDRLLSQDYRTGSDARRTSVNTEFGTTTYVLPGEKRPTGYPELDAVIASYVRTTPNYGFA